MAKEAKIKPEKKRSEHYVNNREFSLAVVEYVKAANAATSVGEEPPTITNYIGECFMKIAEGLSHAPNFIRYSYRDEMVMDGVENCVRAIANFDYSKFQNRKSKVTDLFKDGLLPDDLLELGKEHGSPSKSVTRWYKEWNAGDLKQDLPNAFAYFTQICYYAFLRRLAKEKKQYEIKLKYIESAGIGAFADFGLDSGQNGDSLIEKIRGRTDSIKHRDDSFIDDDSHKPFLPVKKTNRGWTKKAKASTSVDLLDVFTEEDDNLADQLNVVACDDFRKDWDKSSSNQLNSFLMKSGSKNMKANSLDLMVK